VTSDFEQLPHFEKTSAHTNHFCHFSALPSAVALLVDPSAVRQDVGEALDIVGKRSLVRTSISLEKLPLLRNIEPTKR
jgi:hypothetical protein